MTKKSIIAGILSVVVIGLLGFGVASQVWQAQSSYNAEPGFKVLADAYFNKESGMMAEVQGQVTRLIMDEEESAREQKFVIYAISGQSLLVTHDLSRSDRIPVAIGDKVMVRGEYVWSEPGGTLVWTTRDNGSGGRNGWIEHKGERYD